MKVAVPLPKNILAPLEQLLLQQLMKKFKRKDMVIWIFEDCSSSWRSNILLKGITKTIKNETKQQSGGFLKMLLGTLEASLLGNMLTRKGILKCGYRNKQEKRMLRARYGNK